MRSLMVLLLMELSTAINEFQERSDKVERL